MASNCGRFHQFMQDRSLYPASTSTTYYVLTLFILVGLAKLELLKSFVVVSLLSNGVRPP